MKMQKKLNNYIKDKVSSLFNFTKKNWIETFPGAWQQNRESYNRPDILNQVVFACASRIAQDFSILIPKIVEQKGKIWSDSFDNLLSPLLKKPNNYQNHIQFKELYSYCKLMHGNVFILIERNENKKPVALHILNPNKVKLLITEDSEVYYELSDDEEKRNIIENSNSVVEDRIILRSSDIIHDKWNTFESCHPLLGISPLAIARNAVEQNNKIQDYSINFFANSARPSGILTAPGAVSKESADALKAYFDKEFTNNNVGKIALLSDGLTYEPLSLTSADAQLMEQLNFTTEQICSIFKVPVAMIKGDAVSITNEQMQHYYKQCIQKLVEDFEECFDNAFNLNNKEKDNKGIELDPAPLLRLDSKTRFEMHNIALSGSWKTINEVRKEEDLEPIEGGDTVWMQQQNYTLKALVDRDKTNPLSLQQEEPKEALEITEEEQINIEEQVLNEQGEE